LEDILENEKNVPIITNPLCPLSIVVVVFFSAFCHVRYKP